MTDEWNDATEIVVALDPTGEQLVLIVYEGDDIAVVLDMNPDTAMQLAQNIRSLINTSQKEEPKND